jgi:Tfp pilus assembly protein PilF
MSADGDQPDVAATVGTAIAARYAIEEEIGRGGMGVVFRATDLELRRQVAVKVLRGAAFAREDACARFVVEAQATAQLQHPGIVPVYDVGRDAAGRPFFVMKLVRGRTLAQVRAGPAPGASPPSLYALLQIFREVCRAVAYAHARGVVHRDLKPENVMVGAFGEVLVMDWGLAVLADPGAVRRSEREGRSLGGRAGALVGTPGYMAPEQAFGDAAQVGPRTDVFALGAILYDLVAGRPPFVGASAEEVFGKTCFEPPPPLEDAPRELEAIARKALAKRPHERYESASALADDVDAFLEGRSVAARPAGLFGRALKWARRHRAITASAAIVLAASAAIAWIERARHVAAALAEKDAAVAAFERERAVRPPAEAGPEALRRHADAVLGAGLASLEANGRALALAPRDARVRHDAFRAAFELGEEALAFEQWSVAANAFLRAIATDVDSPRALAALAEVEARRIEIARQRLAAVDAVIAAAKEGRLGASPSAYEDALFTLANSREPATVERLALALDGVTREMRRVIERVYAAAATPTASEARAGEGPIEGIPAALEDALSPDRPPAAASLAILTSAARRLRARDGAPVAPTATAERPLDFRRLELPMEYGMEPESFTLARLACEALGRIGIPEGAVPALLRYLYCESTDLRGAAAGVALAGLGGADVERAVARARFRFSGDFARAVGPILARRGFEARIDASTPRGLADHAWMLFEKGDYAGAIADCERALAAEPRFAYALRCRGGARLQAGDAAGAIADYDAALEIEPEQEGATENRGRARSIAGDFAGAIADCSRAIELDSRNALAWETRAFVKLRACDWDGAEFDATHAIECDPRAPAAWTYRGWARLGRNDADGAFADCSRAIEIDSRFAPAWVNRGRAMEMRGDAAAAGADYARAIEIDRKNALGFVCRGRLRAAAGNHAAAIADFTSAIEADPATPGWLAERAAERIVAGDLGGAEADYDATLALAPRDAGALGGRAHVRAQRGDLEGALADCDRVIAVRDDAYVRTMRAWVRLARNEARAAAADLERAVALDPRSFAAWLNLAIARSRTGDAAGAEAAAERAIALDRAAAPGWLERARARLALGRPEAAIEDATRAAALDEADGAALLVRGEARRAAGDRAGALADFAAARERAAGDPSLRARAEEALAQATAGDR